MSKSAENMTENLAPCPFCGSRAVEILAAPCYHDAFFYAVCRDCKMHGPSFLNDPDRAVSAYNSRATTAPKHRPSEVMTGKDRRNIGDALFQGNIHVEHVLPLHAAPDEMYLSAGWEALAERLEDMDEGERDAIFDEYGSARIADAMEAADAESWLCSFRQIGGWAILGTYATVGKISLKENGDFASCSVYCGIERGFIVWGHTYKQAIAKAINAQRRYFDGEVAKAREAAGHGRA